MAPHGSIIIYDGPSKTIISFSVGLILALGEHVPSWYHGKNPLIFLKVASNHGKYPIMVQEAEEGTTTN